MNSLPMVPVWSPACTASRTLEPRDILVVVPLEGQPRVEEFRSGRDALRSVFDLVESGEHGWVYLFEGTRQDITFSHKPTMKTVGVTVDLGDRTVSSDGVLPGTELYPICAE